LAVAEDFFVEERFVGDFGAVLFFEREAFDGAATESTICETDAAASETIEPTPVTISCPSS
jgi:hypothetical protein